MSALRKSKSDEDYQLRINVPVGQDVMWRVIASQHTGFTVADIVKRSGAKSWAVEDYVNRLVKAGIAVRAGRAGPGVALYQVPVAPHYPPILDGRGRISTQHTMAEQVWRALKMLKTFDLDELKATLTETWPGLMISTYIQALEGAGYLLPLDPTGQVGEKKYMMHPAMRTGPMPPRLMRANFLYDVNRQRVANRELDAMEVSL